MKLLIIMLFVFAVFSNSYAVSRDDFIDLFSADGIYDSSSPGGKILFRIYKNTLNDDNSHDSDKGYLIEMPAKDFNSNWLLVLFLKAGEPTWENGVLGYIHKSQINYCEYVSLGS